MQAIDTEALRVAELYKAAAHWRRIRGHLASRDATEFVKFVMKDEESGDRINQEEKHNIMQTICDEWDRGVILSHIESGKTNQITIGRTLYEIGVNPNMRGAIISNTEKQAIKFLRPIKLIIEKDEDWAVTFPDVRPCSPWQDTQITVTRSRTMKDPTVQALGIHGAILGARLDWVVGDDLLDKENTDSPIMRLEVWEWFHANIMGRLTRKARVYMLGTAWHRDDMLHRFGRRKGWYFRRFPACDPKVTKSLSDRWPLERIEQARENDLTEMEFRRQILVLPPEDEDAAFKDEYIKTCSRLGVGVPLVPNMDALRQIPAPDFMRENQSQPKIVNAQGKSVFSKVPRMFESDPPIMIGVDLAGAKKGRRRGKVVFFVVAFHSDQKRQPIWIESGNFDGPGIVERIVSLYDRFNAMFWVENNGVQDWIRQFTLKDHPTIPIYPFSTGRNKADPNFGVDTIATEFKNGGWVLPCVARGPDEFAYDDEIEEWLGQCKDYERDPHTGDHVMASWFAREGGRRFFARKRKRTTGGGVRLIG